MREFALVMFLASSFDVGKSGCLDGRRPIVWDIRPRTLYREDVVDEADRADSAGETGTGVRSGNGTSGTDDRHQLKSVNSGLNLVVTGGNVSFTKSFYDWSVAGLRSTEKVH